MGCSPAGSSIHGIFQARRLEWVAISSSKGSSWPRDRTQVSHIAGRHFTIWATRELKINYLDIVKYQSFYFFQGYVLSQSGVKGLKRVQWICCNKEGSTGMHRCVRTSKQLENTWFSPTGQGAMTDSLTHLLLLLLLTTRAIFRGFSNTLWVCSYICIEQMNK